MTSEEAPEYTSELNILSPVSPKPVHYPVPSNIPVLENQIDLVFNQTGTHMVEPPSQQLPPPMYLDQQAGTYNQDLHHQQQQQQQQQHAQHTQSHSNHPEAYMTSQTGQVGLGQTQAPSQAQNQGHQAYHQAQGQASSIGTDSQTNQVPPVVHYDEKYSYQPGAVASSSDALAPATATASVPSDLPYPSTAAHHLPALSTHSNNEASFQSNSFQAQSHANSSSANASVSELPPGVEANSLQNLLNNLSHASHSQAQSTSPSSQVAHTPSNAVNPANNAQQEQAYPTYTNNIQAQQAQQPQQQQQANGGHTTNPVGANGLPAPPVASFQQGVKLESQRERKQAAGETLDEDDQPWTPETQHRYDNFLTEERKYVTEGNWEQFPYGSRLFVGNLSSERVTKRDIFHVFHKYGDLAQISIKQAYGFVQFLESVGCSKAINAEQGKTIRGKKIRKSQSIENE
jgi:nuclear polyadenylated RNA-binding protein 3